MLYEVELKPRAVKDMKGIPQRRVNAILDAMESMRNDLAGDVKRLTDFTPEYRLRVGDYRILFEIEEPNRIVVYRIRHRRESYRK
jgi:mRNA interferase RelE/StbE